MKPYTATDVINAREAFWQRHKGETDALRDAFIKPHLDRALEIMTLNGMVTRSGTTAPIRGKSFDTCIIDDIYEDAT